MVKNLLDSLKKARLWVENKWLKEEAIKVNLKIM